MTIRFAAAIATALVISACDRAPQAPPAPQPVLTAPHPGPVLRDTLPVIERRPHVPLPRAKPKPKAKTAAAKPLPGSSYTCDDIKLAEALLSQQRIEAEAKKRGATPDQVHAAQKACQ